MVEGDDLAAPVGGEKVPGELAPEIASGTRDQSARHRFLTDKRLYNCLRHP
jgi:hypothetical protein